MVSKYKTELRRRNKKSGYIRQNTSRNLVVNIRTCNGNNSVNNTSASSKTYLSNEAALEFFLRQSKRFINQKGYGLVV